MDSTDVAVIGAGPAGSTAARLLAQWGHAVVMVSAPESHRGFAESLPPSARKLFGVLDILHHIETAGFYRSTGNTVWWGEDEPRIERFVGPDLGYQIYRPDFDRVLASKAEHAGVRICQQSQVRTVELTSSGTATITYSAATGEARSLAAKFVLDCSGRAGVIARRGFRQSEPGRATLAIVGVWRSPDQGWALPDLSHTLIEAYRNGWAWSVPVSPTERYVTVMVDRHEAELTRGEGLAAAYRAELAKTRYFDRMLGNSSLERPPWSVDASLYSASSYAGPGFLLVGDAGSFIDPLSSFGVKKAMASAWLAAVVVNTCLVNPSMRSPALDLFAGRERAVYASYLEQSSRFFQEGLTRHRHAFWETRADTPSAHQADQIDDDEISRDPRVAAAWEALRRSPSISLEPSPHLTFGQLATVKGREVVFERALIGSEPSRPIRFVRGVDLLSLVDNVRANAQVPDLFESYCRSCGPTPLPDFLAALATLVGKGLVTNRAPVDAGGKPTHEPRV